MRDHDIQLLALGVAIGADLMLLVQMFFGILDDRRERKAVRESRAALKRAAGDHYLSSFRAYQVRRLHQRSRV